MGYLKRLSDKRYRIKYDVIPTNEKPRQIKTETLEGVNKKEAEAILAQRKAEVTKKCEAIANGEQVKENITLSTLFERFLKQKRKQKEENTIRRYETLVKLYLKPQFGDSAGEASKAASPDDRVFGLARAWTRRARCRT
ncbi:MAG: hypothetical protein WBX23_17385 [Candidatus Cybelea sp.]